MDKQINTVAANKVSWECLQKIANGIVFNIFLIEHWMHLCLLFIFNETTLDSWALQPVTGYGCSVLDLSLTVPHDKACVEMHFSFGQIKVKWIW